MSWLRRIIQPKGDAQPSAPDRETLDSWLRAGYERAIRGDLAEAERLYRQLLEHDPRDPDALYFLGIIARTDHRATEAAEFFRQAVGARPNDPAFWAVLGATYHHLKLLPEAALALRSALSLRPGHVETRNNLAAVLVDTGRGDEACEEMERLIAEDFASGQVHFNLGNVYREHAQIEQAIAASQRAIELMPDYAYAFTNLLLTLNYSEKYDAAALYEEHRRFGARFARPYVEPDPDRSAPRLLRIGYVSPDFRRHVVAYFMEPILANHDRRRFEIFCYYTYRQDDEVTGRLRRLADHWLDCATLSDDELTEHIRRDGIDILVDLAGHTGDHRLLVFAAKAAPLQVSYLGYPNTTGLAAVDYRITDARADPPDEADRWSVERLLRPWPTYFCYRPPSDAPEIGPPPAKAAGHITFGCFNNLPKVSEPFLDAAARVLAAVPGSRLRLKAKALEFTHVAERLRQRFASAGIDPARVDIRGWELTVAKNLAAYGDIDIALDTFPYNGATTTCEALWMGVPVVTVPWDRHAGRMGSSLLHAVGLQELVARNVDEYVKICAALAGDADRLAQLRGEMRTRMRQSPLMDEPGFTGAIERCYREIWDEHLRPDSRPVAVDDGSIADLLRRASTLRASGEAVQAEEAYKAVLLNRADNDEALAALWDLAYETGNHGAAIEWLRRGIAANGRVPRQHYMMGCSLLARGSPADAVASFRQALELDPRMAKARNNLGCALEALGEMQEAGQCYRTAIELDPHLADALYNVGNLHRQLGDPKQAIAYIRRALDQNSARADWRCNLAELLYDQIDLDVALQSYDASIRLDPSYARAYAGRGQALLALGRMEEADADIRKAMELEPRNPSIRSAWLLSLHYRHGEDAARLSREHREWARQHTRGIGRQAARAEHERHLDRRLNIGYVSPDFQRHSVAYFIESVLAAHDRERFKIFCYSNVSAPDEVTERIRSRCEEWRDISGLNDDWVAERIRADRIDILVDLAGHTGGGRMLLFARKPAPVQVTWLGYPNTSGLASIDYRLTDAIADPAGETDAHHSEALERLPNGFLCYSAPPDSPDVARPPFLDTGYVTFGCFNQLPKLTAPMVALWARMLKAMPDARLVLKSFGLSAQSARRELQERFVAHGIAAGRIDAIASERSHARHLEKYRHIDIALDTFPYNGATTTCEALWMGVPVVTLAGKTHVSRVGASILARLGLADFVAETEDQYLEKALSLARSRERLSALRGTMRQLMESSPLLDARRFTGTLEGAYRSMWERWQQAEERAHESLRLHIGGIQNMPGWKTLNLDADSGADYVGDGSDLSQFADESVDEIYASHVVQRFGYGEKLPRALAGFHRVLKKGGTAKIAVPDLEVLCRMFLDPRYSAHQRYEIMRRVFGGQAHEHDFHRAGLSYEILYRLLTEAGFERVERVKEFGLFEDDSLARFAGIPISLNVIAYK